MIITAMDASTSRSVRPMCNTQHMTTTFWDRLTSAFEGAGLDTSQSAIARQVGLGQSAVAKWASGAGYPTLRHCIHIARMTDVSVEWLLTGRGNKKQEGSDMDELTQALLNHWAELSEDARREILDFVEFRATKEQDDTRPAHKPRPPRKQ